MKNVFYFTEKVPFVLKIFKFLYFPLPHSPLPLVVIAQLIEEAEGFDIIIRLNWNLKTQIV